MEPSPTIYDPIAVANFFVQKSLETGTEVTPMKLLKLVYIAHGWHLGLYGKPLIDEAVEAWTYGPVVPDVYRKFKEYGRGRITKLASEMKISGLSVQFVTPTVPDTDQQTRSLLEEIWKVYGDKDGLYLSAITHQEGTPWSLTEKNGIIAQDKIEAHYRTLANTANPTTA